MPSLSNIICYKRAYPRDSRHGAHVNHFNFNVMLLFITDANTLDWGVFCLLSTV